MVQHTENVYEHSEKNQRRPEPKRKTIRSHRQIWLGYLHLLEEQAEASDDKTEAHHRQAGSNPGQESSFRRQEIAGAALILACHAWTAS